MTLGERVQELRKRDGLSQEQLGEKLGVSRQAISKWEGDVTIPEVDKLVALSRLFRVNVGVLLGVEEPPPEGEDAPLNERELAAVEAVAARCKPAAPRWPTIGLAVLCVAALAVSIVANIITNRSLEEYKSQTESRLASLQGQISMVQMPSPVVPAADDFFSAQIYEVDSVDIDAGTVTLHLSVTPKRYVEGMLAQFTITGQSFSPVTSPLEAAQGQTFTRLFTCPLDDNITVTAAIKDGDATETRPLGNFLDLKKESGITLEVAWNKLNADMVDVGIAVGNYSSVEPAMVSLRVKKDGAILKEETLSYGEPWNEADTTSDDGSAFISVVGPVTFYVRMENWPEGEIEAYLKDTDGREYTVPLE